MALTGYNVRKAAQVVAFFAIQQGGSINILKLAKLVYLADRGFLEKYDSPILYDRLVSMPHGPANSVTLNFINGLFEETAKWDEFVSDREKHNVGVATRDLKVEDLDELSRAERAVLEDVWNRFGHMTQYQLRDFTHRNCPEWEDPKGSSSEIPYERVLKYLRKDPSIADAIDADRVLADITR